MKDFRKFFDEQLLPELVISEKYRQAVLYENRKRTRFITFMWISLVLSVSSLFLLSLLAGLFFLLALGMLIMAAKQTDKRNNFKNKIHTIFKDSILPAILNFIDKDLTFDHKKTISMERFSESTLFDKNVTHYRGEDHVAGLYGKTFIEFSEVKALRRKRNLVSFIFGSIEWETVFLGVFFVADFNKHFTGRTFVFPQKSKDKPFELKEVKLEDLKFEEKYKVLSEDQIEARYILSTSLMNRILEFNEKTGTPIRLSFINSTLYLAMNNVKDLFEPDMNKNMASYEYASENFESLLLFVGIVDDLNLNTRIWTKG